MANQLGSPYPLPPLYCDAYLPAFFAAALVAGALGLSRLHPLWVCAALPLASTAVVLSRIDVAARRLCLPAAALSLGLAAGTLIAVPPAQRPLDSRLLTGGRAILGYLVEDAAVYADSDTRYRLHVTRVIGTGAEFEARGVATVVTAGGIEHSAGRRLRVEYGSGDLWTASDRVVIRSRRVEAAGWHAAHFAWRDALRRRLFERIDSMGYRPGGLFRALVTGSRSRLSLEQQRLFRESGSSHLLALSGMHLGIIAAVAFACLRLLLGKRAAFVFTVVACAAYIYLVGARPSLLRAMAMFVTAGVVRLCGRAIEPVNTLSLAVIALAAAMPSLLHDLSFQLSALSILGIIGPGTRIRRALASWLPGALAIPLAAALGAQLTTAPLALAVFGTVYPVALLSSIVLIPLVSLFVWSGLIWLGLGAINIVVPAALLLLPEQALSIHALADLFSRLPAAAPSAVSGSLTLALVGLVLLAVYRRDLALLPRRAVGGWPL